MSQKNWNQLLPIPKEIRDYNAAQAPDDKRICNALAELIEAHLPGAACGWPRA